MDTSCYFWLPCRFTNFKPSLIIFQRANLSNQCTSLRKLHLYSGLCGLLMAALHIFHFPHLHSNCIKLANKFGVKHTVVMADQALHDISYGLREQASPDDDI